MNTRGWKPRAFLKSAIVFMASIAILSCVTFCEPIRGTPLRFVQMCDPQLGIGGYEHDMTSFMRAVRQINAMKPDFVLICGDLVHEPNDQSFADFNRIRAGFTVPCYCVPGNHDVGNKPDSASLERYRRTVARDYSSIEYKGYTFVFVNTQLWKAHVEGESNKQDVWLEDILMAARSKNSPVFVVGHIPLFMNELDEKEGYHNLPIQKRRQLLALFRRHGVVAMLSGHTHQTITNESQGMHLVGGDTTSKRADTRPLGFRLWTVASPDSLVHEFIPLNEVSAHP